MCDLNTSTDYHEVHNLYKVALKNTKTGDYYSPATGVKYLNNGYQPITKTREQKRITSYFRDDLFSMYFFKDTMVGELPQAKA